MNMNWQKATNKGLEHAHYEADALILYCVDNRGKKALEEFLFKKSIRSYDLIMVPGGAKAIAGQNEAERIMLLSYIKKLLELHKAKKIILTTHIDCGACGGSAAFDNDKKTEHSAHEQWLLSAKSLLVKLFTNIPVETYFVDFEGFWQIT
jgi:carbonic anhydrase